AACGPACCGPGPEGSTRHAAARAARGPASCGPAWEWPTAHHVAGIGAVAAIGRAVGGGWRPSPPWCAPAPFGPKPIAHRFFPRWGRQPRLVVRQGATAVSEMEAAVD